MNLKKLEKGQILNLSIVCNSKQRDISLVEDNIYKVRLQSQPMKGKANKELINFFKTLGYRIDVIRGEKSHSKIIRVLEII